jgi:hypothetical protein
VGCHRIEVVGCRCAHCTTSRVTLGSLKLLVQAELRTRQLLRPSLAVNEAKPAAAASGTPAIGVVEA